jgi:hypothetical protein
MALLHLGKQRSDHVVVVASCVIAIGEPPRDLAIERDEQRCGRGRRVAQRGVLAQQLVPPRELEDVDAVAAGAREGAPE